MRCTCCNRNLNDFESTLKSAQTGDYLDTCLKCLEGSGIDTEGRNDLNPYDESSDEDFDETGEDDFLDER